MRRNSCCQDDPVRSADFRQISGNAQFHVPEGIGSDPQLPDPLPNGGYCHRSCGLSVLGRLRKNNITQYNMKIKQAILHSSSVFDI